MTQNTGGQGQEQVPYPTNPANLTPPAQGPTGVQDRIGGGQAQMPVIQPSAGEVVPRPDPAPPARPSGHEVVSGGSATTNVVRVFGDYKREGRFRLDEKTSAMLAFSDMLIDLREAQIPAQAELTVYALFGDVKVIVPPGMSVSTSGFAIFGDDKIDDTQSAPDGPTLRIHRVGAFGDVKVKTALPGEKISKRWKIF